MTSPTPSTKVESKPQFYVGTQIKYDTLFLDEQAGIIDKIIADSTSFSRIYTIYPNDKAPNDSAAKLLSSGILMRTQPGGQYQLTVGMDPLVAQKQPVLKLFTTRDLSQSSFVVDKLVGKIESENTQSPFTFRFTNTLLYQNDLAIMITDDDDQRYPEIIESLSLSGSGDYVGDFFMNIIMTGKLPGCTTKLQQDSLAKIIFDETALIYNQIDGLNLTHYNILHAEENPAHGSLFPVDQPYTYEILSTDLDKTSEPDLLSQWNEPEINGVDIVVLSLINDDNYLGLSPVYGNTLKAGNRSTVQIAVTAKSGSKIDTMSYDLVANTVAHEMGHFLGLRHTTSTNLDLLWGRDYSNVEDGFEDTPNCLLGKSNLAKLSCTFDQGRAARKIRQAQPLGKTQANSCADRFNLMFPEPVDGVLQNLLSVGQLDMILQNLTLYPH